MARLYLPFLVEVKGRAYWEGIAAFNVERVATAYAQECFAANGPALHYRVKKGSKLLWNSEG